MEIPSEELAKADRERPGVAEREKILRACIEQVEERAGRQLFRRGIQYDLIAECTTGFTETDLSDAVQNIVDDRERRAAEGVRLPRATTEDLIDYLDDLQPAAAGGT